MNAKNTRIRDLLIAALAVVVAGNLLAADSGSVRNAMSGRFTDHASAMVLYIVATSLYLTGGAGPVVGWPIFMGATITASTLLGVFSGEWKGVSRRAYGWLYGGVALLILAVVLAGLSNLFLAKPQ